MKIVNVTNPDDSFTEFSCLCKNQKKWGIYISFPDTSEVELFKAAPYLQEEMFKELLNSGFGYILLDSRAEMEELYNQTVGDDGPTVTNSYSGEFAVYALTCNPDGKLLTENT